MIVRRSNPQQINRVAAVAVKQQADEFMWRGQPKNRIARNATINMEEWIVNWISRWTDLVRPDLLQGMLDSFNGCRHGVLSHDPVVPGEMITERLGPARGGMGQPGRRSLPRATIAIAARAPSDGRGFFPQLTEAQSPPSPGISIARNVVSQQQSTMNSLDEKLASVHLLAVSTLSLWKGSRWWRPDGKPLCPVGL